MGRQRLASRARRQRGGHHRAVQRPGAGPAAVERVPHSAALGHRDPGRRARRPDALPVLTAAAGPPGGVNTVARIYAACYVRVVIATATLEAIAEPTRLRILEAVRTGERSVGELVDELGMNQPGVSRHLK